LIKTNPGQHKVAWVGQTLRHQIALLAYIDVFWILAMIGAVMVPIALS